MLLSRFDAEQRKTVVAIGARISDSRYILRKPIDGRAIGRVISDWNSCYPATPLRIDAVMRGSETVYSAQVAFPDGTNVEFDVTLNALHAPARFPALMPQRGPSKYTEGQWILFDELSNGTFKLVSEYMGRVRESGRSRGRKSAALARTSSKA